MMENARQIQDQYADVVNSIEENSYADGISVMGDNETDVLKETKNLIEVMEKASFAVKR